MEKNDVTIDITADVSGLKRGTAEAKASLDGLTRTLKQPAAALDEVAKSGDRASASFSRSGVIIGTGIAITVAAVWKLAKGTVDLADSLGDMSQRTGVAVKDLAGLKTISEQSGTSLNSVATGIQYLNRSIGLARSGNKEYDAALQRLGVTAKEPKEALYQLADTVKKTNDPTRIAADLQKVLSRNYAEMIPLLKEGGEGLRKAADANASFAEQMARLAPDADKFNDNLAQMKTNSAGLAATVLSNVIPSLSEYLGMLNEILATGTLLDKIKFFTLGYANADVMDKVVPAKERIDEYNAKLRELNAELSEIKGGLLSSKFDLRIGPLEKEIADLTTRRNALIDQAVTDINKPHSSGGATPPATPTRPPPDPLAGILASTDIEKTREYNRLLDLLNQRFDSGRKNSALYSQAVEQLNKRFGVNQPLDDYARALQSLIAGTTIAKTEELYKNIDVLNQAYFDGKIGSEQYQQAIDSLTGSMDKNSKAAQEDAGALQSLIAGTDLAKTEALYKNIDVLNQAFFEGKIGAEQYQQAIDKLTGTAVDKGKSDFAELKDAIEGWSRDAAQAMADFAISGEGSMTDMVNGILEQMARLAIQKTVTDPLMNGLEGVLKTILPTKSSNGNVFSSPGLHAYANTVVSQPTVFPFARGIGLMGEAGPEAIMPLKRLGNGKLGVAAEGGGGGNLSVEIHNYSGQPVQQRESIDSRGNRKMEVVIGEMVAGEMVRPGSAPFRAKYAPRMVRR